MVDEESIIDRILEAHGHVPPPEGAFTVQDYIDQARVNGVAISGPQTLKLLKDEMRAGQLHGRKLKIDGRERWVFWG